MRSRTGLTPAPPHSVKELLARRVPALTRVTAQAARQNFWNCWLSTHLPPEIRPKVSGVTERDGTLVIFAETAAWCARLRYAVLELGREIRAADPSVTDIEVRVLPRG
ncbi:MAG TPA: DciA family protein [Steroidobacteraceae bacterium]|nr:DciA family protein [Steroidobacteraceae bacterium]